ncbi:PREDICTED: glutamic acid-rich protein-like [Nicrophorus vespilloides]|uniref:Glutamic acid-rich protein-like n=1 Tax=Nicrophorus vespilloides TaxID=110193 RepID=A0ABM1MU71_NICVS|nr:PREDICTED: glutamic acid-rich protein-like [Nicrophorus vespilloides]
MVLSFKKGKFLFRRKVKKPVEKPPVKAESIVCLRYVQFDEFDTNYVIKSTQKSETIVPVAVAAPENVISRINSRSLESVSTEEYYDEEELTQLQKTTAEVESKVKFAPEEEYDKNNVEQRKTDKTVRIETDKREEVSIETVADVSKKQETEPKEEKPIKSILKKGTTEESEKKSTLIFMTENHDEDDEEKEEHPLFDDGKKEDEVDEKPLKKFNQENVYNKTTDEDQEEEEKEYSSNAASIFFDDDEPEPTERVRKIDLKRQDDDVVDDAASVGSQTSA